MARAAKRAPKPKPAAREVSTEIAHTLLSPLWEHMYWIAGIDLHRARDADVTDGEILDPALALLQITRDDADRLMFLRGALTPAHRAQLVDAIEHTQRAPLVELLAWTCTTAREFAAALRRAEAGKPLQPAIDYAQRRFVGEPAVAKKLAARGMKFATTAHGGKWDESAQLAWLALYVSDTRESAEVVAQMIQRTYIYTNHATKERVAANAGKRARMLTHRARCAAALLEAVPESYTDAVFTQSAAVVAPAKTLPLVEEKWREYTTYQMDNNPARVALGGLLALAPKQKRYHDAAKQVLPKLLKEHAKDASWGDLGMIEGLVTGIGHGRIKALYPLLEQVARWKFTGSRFDNQGPDRAELAGTLLRRRAQRALVG